MYKNNAIYEVIKEIKLHTKPLRKAQVIQIGKYKGETEKTYLFEYFRVKKTNVVSIVEVV